MDKSEIIELIEDGKSKCAILSKPESFSDSGIAATIGEISCIFDRLKDAIAQMCFTEDQSVGAETGIK